MRIAVVGAGPAGFYACQALLKRFPEARVDLLERLPVPFGLVRYGVAPDHPATRNVMSQFSALMRDNRARLSFYGNVPVSFPSSSSTMPGASVLTCERLSEIYDVTVRATGAAAPRRLAEGVEMPAARVHLANDLMLWLNGHPDFHMATGVHGQISAQLAQTVRSSRAVTVIGAGNVALDAARLLLRPCEDLLRVAELSPTALQALQGRDDGSSSSYRRGVTVVARRAAQHAAWTTAALREVVAKIPGIVTHCDLRAVRFALDGEAGKALKRSQRRSLDLLLKHAVDTPDGDMDGESRGGKDNVLALKFNQAVDSMRLSEDGQRVHTHLVNTGGEGDDSAQRGEHGSDGVFLSLGYIGGTGDTERYGSVGWANGKASGIIGDNKWDAETVIESMAQPPATTLTVGAAGPGGAARPGIEEWVRETAHEVVPWGGWERIDEEERRRAEVLQMGSGRVRIESVGEMLQAARGEAVMVSQSA